MDLLRTCYSHKVYWDDAKTLSSTIIWYRASDNAEWFPYPHVFSSERYDTVHWFDDGAGEDELTGPTYYKGFPPARFTGQNFCGDPSWYLGAPSNAPALALDENGWPACCHVEGGAYGYQGPSVNPPPPSPSGFTCDGCLEGIGPATFKVTLSGFTGVPCAGFNGTYLLPNTGIPCIWQTTIVVGGVSYLLELNLLPGLAFCGIAGEFAFTPPPLPMDCFAVQTWNPVISSDPCSSAFNHMTSQPA